MKKHASFIFGLGFICLSACLATAQDGGKPKGPPPAGDGAARLAEFVKRADTDADGKISKDEFAALSRKETDERFGRADANSDGFIDQAEFGQFAQRGRDAGGGMRRPGGESGPRPSGEGEGGFRRPPISPEGAPPNGSPPPGGPEGGRPGAGGPGGPGGPGAGGPGGGRGGMFGDPKESFKRMDADSNGSVSEEEYVSAMNRLREMMGRGGPGGPGGSQGAPGGFRRPGGEGGPPPSGGEGGFRRPPVEEAKPEAKPEGEKPVADKPKEAI